MMDYVIQCRKTGWTKSVALDKPIKDIEETINQAIMRGAMCEFRAGPRGEHEIRNKDNKYLEDITRKSDWGIKNV